MWLEATFSSLMIDHASAAMKNSCTPNPSIVAVTPSPTWRYSCQVNAFPGAGSHDSHDAVPDREAVRRKSDRHHFPGKFEPGNVWRRAGRSGVQAGPLPQIGIVHAGCADADEHLAHASGSLCSRIAR
jgi:hypothetical protein